MGRIQTEKSIVFKKTVSEGSIEQELVVFLFSPKLFEDFYDPKAVLAFFLGQFM